METTAERSFYQLAAVRKFPFSAQNIRGDGKFCCVSKCARHWRVLLFPTIEAMNARYDAWFQNGCGPNCKSDHFTFDLSL
jgi:hypothetical protein